MKPINTSATKIKDIKPPRPGANPIEIGCIFYTYDEEGNITKVMIDYRVRDARHKKIEATIDRYLEMNEILDIIKKLDRDAKQWR